MEILGQFGLAQTFYFPLIDRGTIDFESTPVTFAAADTQVSIDGGAFANSTNTPAHEGNGIYALALTAAETAGKRIVVTLIDSATKTWEDQALIISTAFSGQIESNKAIIIGEVDTATFVATTTALESFTISPTVTEETVADIFIGRLILFTDGAAYGELTDITDSVLANSKVKLTYTAIISTPDDASHFVIV